MRKLLIRTWFGSLPSWTEKFKAHVEHLKQYGWEFLIVDDIEWFKKRCRETLGVEVQPEPGTRKAGDYDPYLGVIFAKELRGYDFWGHFNLDCVYGRLDRWLPDAFLENIDVFGNDPGAICGPFSIYRNRADVNELFREAESWKENLETSDYYGFDEAQFSRAVHQVSLSGSIRFASGFFQSHDKMWRHRGFPKIRIDSDGSLIDVPLGREIMLFHFNATRTWPA